MEFLSKRAAVSSPLELGFNPTLENWLQLNQKNNNAPANEELQTEGNGARYAPTSSEATSVTTRALSATSGHHLCVNGAAGKISKKRSRASRRAPTTMLSTDASNFRAMVQQFTGIPELPFGSAAALSATASQGSLLARSFPHGAHLSSVAYCYNNNNNNHNNAQHYAAAFPFHSLLHDDNMRSSAGGNSLFFSRVSPFSQGHQPGLLDDVGLNLPPATVFSSPAVMLSSERRPDYLV